MFTTTVVRVIFDVSFFIIVTTISLNIVFGIIVDTFTELRDEKVCFDAVVMQVGTIMVILSLGKPKVVI